MSLAVGSNCGDEFPGSSGSNACGHRGGRISSQSRGRIYGNAPFRREGDDFISFSPPTSWEAVSGRRMGGWKVLAMKLRRGSRFLSGQFFFR